MAAYNYDYSYPAEGQYAASYAPPPTTVANDPAATANEGLQYFNEARGAFAQGDYRNAMRLASHAAVESPQNAKGHELMSLASFALGDYLAAATQAHAAMILGPPCDWNDLYAYYNDADRYTGQLRKLEKSVASNPKSAPDQFLLGYHYLMTGSKGGCQAAFCHGRQVDSQRQIGPAHTQAASGEPRRHAAGLAQAARRRKIAPPPGPSEGQSL